MKRLSFYMLLAAFLSGLFYSASYPYIYAETVKAVTQGYISFESVFACLGSIVFCGLWNKYSDKLFRGYRIILWLEVLFDLILFADVLIRGDLKFYFVFNIIIYSVITKNLACGGTKMRAIVNPTEKQREWYDNSCNIVCSAATLIGVGMATILKPNLTILFVLALCGNIIDNFIYLGIYGKIIKGRKCNV